MLGTRGSGKTTQGEWLAQQLGIFHIQFREQLQMLIMAKTKMLVPHADEVASEESLEDLEALIKEARGENEKETEDTSTIMSDMEVSFDKLPLEQDFQHEGSSNCGEVLYLDLFCTCLCPSTAGGDTD